MKVSLVGQSVLHEPILERYGDRLAALTRIIGASEVAFTNLETTIAGRHGGWPMIGTSLTTPTRAIFSPPVVLDELKSMGFNVLSMCNNHAFLLGPDGVLSTIEEVAARGFIAAGLGASLTEAARPGRKLVNARLVSLVAMDGGPQAATVYAIDPRPPHVPARPGNNPLRVTPLIEATDAQLAVLAEMRRTLGHFDLRGHYLKTAAYDPEGTVTLSPVLYPGAPTLQFRRGDVCRAAFEVNADDLARNLAAIRAEKAAGSFVITYIHHHLWHKQWERTPDWMQGVCRELIDAGADIVVSHGVPVLHGVELHRGRPIFYSLGNFIFHPFSDSDVWQNDRIWLSVIATCTYEGERLRRIEFVPIAVGGQAQLEQGRFDARDAPELATGRCAAQVLEWLVELSRPFGSRIEIADGKAVLEPPGT